MRRTGRLGLDDRAKLFLTFLIGVALLHGATLGGAFVWDDHAMIEENPGLRDLSNLPAFFGSNYFGERADVELYRPLVNVTLALDYHLWGAGADGRATPLGFRATNVLLHLLVGLLLFLLLRRITSRRWLPEIGAALFLVHPASAEPVGWIVGRGDLLAAVLGLATIHLHLSGRRRPALHLLALLAFLLALFGKLAAAPVPLLILLVEWKRSGRVGFRAATLWRYGAYALPAAAYFLIRAGAMDPVFPAGTGLAWKDPPQVAALFVSGALLCRHAFVFLVPTGLAADYSADPVFAARNLTRIAGQPEVLLLALLLPVLLLGVFLARRRAPWLAFGVAWFFAALLPVSQVVPIGAVTADRFLYLPAVGGCVVLAALVLALPCGRICATLLLLACFAPLTAMREAVFQNDLALNRDVLASYPRDPDTWNRLGLHWNRCGNRGKERAAYERGLQAAPGDRWLLNNLGALEKEAGRFPEARAALERALRRSPRRDALKGKIAWNLATVLLAEGREPEAALVLEEAVLCRPPLPQAFERLGRLYRDRLDRPARAEALLRTAARIRAAYATARLPR